MRLNNGYMKRDINRYADFMSYRIGLVDNIMCICFGYVLVH